MVSDPVGSTTAKVYSAVDGRALREVSVPPWRDQLMTLGRQIIQWKRLGGDRMELAAIDARSGEVAWRRQYESEACVDVDMGRYVAAMVAGQSPDLGLLTAEPLKPVPFYPIREPAVRLVAGWYQFLDAIGR